jgi:SynChlorMet cassette protein ScmC
MLHGSCESWDVQHAVKLKSIFFLEKAGEEQILPLGTSQAICLLTESAEQVSRLMSRWLEKDEARMLRLQRFENVCSLAQAVPSYILRLSRHGTFWQDVEEALKRER